jgi:predicted TIM-barrel fold metal-dependent hydrolase
MTQPSTVRAQRPESPLVDCHVHVFDAGMPLVSQPRHRPSYAFTAEQLEATLDTHGVKFCVIAAASPWGDCNDYVVQSLRNRPLWRGTAILDPDRTTRAELDALDAQGMVGVRLPWIGLDSLPDLDSWPYRRFLWRLADLGWHVHLHLEGARIPDVLPLLERSGIRIVIDHMARPTAEHGIDCPGVAATLRSVEKGNTWVKLSAAYRQTGLDTVALARHLLSRGGRERMLWASDCPFVGVESTTYQQTLDWYLQAVPDPMDRRVMDLNAIDLYFR